MAIQASTWGSIWAEFLVLKGNFSIWLRNIISGLLYFPILTLNMLPKLIIKSPTTNKTSTLNQPNVEVCRETYRLLLNPVIPPNWHGVPLESQQSAGLFLQGLPIQLKRYCNTMRAHTAPGRQTQLTRIFTTRKKCWVNHIARTTWAKWYWKI